MKQRILVMNQSRLVQSEESGQWSTVKVDPAGAMKPGIYNIYLATQADKAKVHDGVIVHADKDHIFQQVGKSFVMHNRTDLDVVPLLGVNLSIKYDAGKAVTSSTSAKLGRGIS